MSVDRVLADVVSLSAFGKKLPGTPAEAAACRFIADTVGAMDLHPTVHAFKAFIGRTARPCAWRQVRR